MLARLDGETRVSVIIGTPIAQVRSPEGITRVLQARGVNALLVPFEVSETAVQDLVTALGRVASLDGIVVTVPHKQAAFRCCVRTSERARFLEAVNVMRRLPEGGFTGDHLDGESLLGAVGNVGFEPAAKRALLLGAGGAGSAIALSLMESGLGEISIADIDATRRDSLVLRLGSKFHGRVRHGGTDPRGFDLVVNATPQGMRAGDAAPLDTALLSAGMTVADVVTPPDVSALIAGARAAGCKTVTGQEMFDAGAALLADFLLGR